jgi:hypothetical protein
MQPAVVVQIDSAEATPSQVQALLASCDLGMHGRARCVLARDRPATDGAAFASVTFEGPEGAQASVEVRLAGETGGRRRARDLAFSESDPAIERWRATGFAIATVVGDIIGEGEAAEAAAAAPPAHAAPGGEAPATRAESPVRWWLDGRFTGGLGAESSPAALGGDVGVLRRFGEGRWFGVASVGFSAQPSHGAEIVRPGGALGVGIASPRVGDRYVFSLRVQPRIEYIDVTGRDTVGATGQAGRWALGLGQALDVAWMPSEGFGFVGGAELRELTGPTAIQAHGQLLALIPAVDLVLQAGLRYGLP